MKSTPATGWVGSALAGSVELRLTVTGPVYVRPGPGVAGFSVAVVVGAFASS